MRTEEKTPYTEEKPAAEQRSEQIQSPAEDVRAEEKTPYTEEKPAAEQRSEQIQSPAEDVRTEEKTPYTEEKPAAEQRSEQIQSPAEDVRAEEKQTGNDEEPEDEVIEEDKGRVPEEAEAKQGAPVVNLASKASEETETTSPQQIQQHLTSNDRPQQQVEEATEEAAAVSEYEENTVEESVDKPVTKPAPSEPAPDGENETASYLSKIFSSIHEETYTKLRMCIVQEGESLDTIAERYDVSVNEIMRVNRIKEERLEAGQILYVPRRKSTS
ncbi:spore germination protein YaaH [Texcoconibacillus texcoconensis]|uniref:Spore germination protein YaaH n=1 Tax=Texcoconibacillus texcoconensis TaxID=1095777 RepID=A0A840QSX5_9BACI|nr:spore germination protein YaaH [Texcoconibacillus texcoconensis]